MAELPQKQTILLENFTGGINLNVNNTDATSLFSAINLEYDSTGKLKTRPGCISYLYTNPVTELANIPNRIADYQDNGELIFQSKNQIFISNPSEGDVTEVVTGYTLGDDLLNGIGNFSDPLAWVSVPWTVGSGVLTLSFTTGRCSTRDPIYVEAGKFYLVKIELKLVYLAGVKPGIAVQFSDSADSYDKTSKIENWPATQTNINAGYISSSRPTVYSLCVRATETGYVHLCLYNTNAAYGFANTSTIDNITIKEIIPSTDKVLGDSTFISSDIQSDGYNTYITSYMENETNSEYIYQRCKKIYKYDNIMYSVNAGLLPTTLYAGNDSLFSLKEYSSYFKILPTCDTTAGIYGNTYPYFMGILGSALVSGGALTYSWAYHLSYYYRAEDSNGIMREYVDYGPVNTITVTACNTLSPSANILYYGLFAYKDLFNHALFNSKRFDPYKTTIKLYRTVAGGSVHYLTVEQILGDLDSYDRSYICDTTIDADIIKNEILYTNGGTLNIYEPQCPRYMRILNGFAYYGNCARVSQQEEDETAPDSYFSWPNRIYQSSYEDYDGVPLELYIDLPYEITGLAKTSTHIVGFCQNSMYRLEGTYDDSGRGGISFIQIGNNVGCVWYKSIVEVDGKVYFMAKDGFYVTDGFTLQKLPVKNNTSLDILFNNISASLPDGGSSTKLYTQVSSAYDSQSKLVYWSINNFKLAYPIQIDSNIYKDIYDPIFVYDAKFDSFTMWGLEDTKYDASISRLYPKEIFFSRYYNKDYGNNIHGMIRACGNDTGWIYQHGNGLGIDSYNYETDYKNDETLELSKLNIHASPEIYDIDITLVDAFEMIYFNNKWYYMASVSYGYALYNSTDAITWTQVSGGGMVNIDGVQNIRVVNSKLIIIGSDSTLGPTLVYTSDGVTWSHTVLTNFAAAGAIYDIAYGNGKYVVCGGLAFGDYTIKTEASSDLITWDGLKDVEDDDGVSCSIAFSESEELFVLISTTSGASKGKAYTSTDAETWTDIGKISDSRALDKIFWSDSINKFISLNSTTISSSPDGVNWSESQPLPPYILYNIVSIDDKVFLISSDYLNGYIYVSNDGIHWWKYLTISLDYTNGIATDGTNVLIGHLDAAWVKTDYYGYAFKKIGIPTTLSTSNLNCGLQNTYKYFNDMRLNIKNIGPLRLDINYIENKINKTLESINLMSRYPDVNGDYNGTDPEEYMDFIVSRKSAETSRRALSRYLNITTSQDTKLYSSTQTGKEWNEPADIYSAAELCSNTALLLHMNGRNGGTEFIDSSASAKIVTSTLATTITSIKKFGTACGDFNGLKYLTIPASIDWAFGLGDFTIDFWFYAPATLTAYPYIFRFEESNGSNEVFSMYITATTIGINYALPDPWGSPDPNNTEDYDCAATITPEVWRHVAIVRNSGTLAVYLNGTKLTSADSDDLSAIPVGVATYILTIGGMTATASKFYIDEFRVSKGLARWTDNFTPPSIEYPDFVSTSTDLSAVILPSGSWPQYVDNNIITYTYGGTTYSSKILYRYSDNTLIIDATANATAVNWYITGVPSGDIFTLQNVSVDFMPIGTGRTGYNSREIIDGL